MGEKAVGQVGPPVSLGAQEALNGVGPAGRLGDVAGVVGDRNVGTGTARWKPEANDRRLGPAVGVAIAVSEHDNADAEAEPDEGGDDTEPDRAPTRPHP